jgi:hypothetical protein
MPWDTKVENAIGGAAQRFGVDPNLLKTFARIESGGRPNARTGSYKGLFQLSDSEFGKYGGGNIYDPAANASAAAQKLARESAQFRAKYGRDPQPNDLYMIHQQGEGGYAAHTANPNAPAWQNMYSTAEGRQKGPGWAKQAIWGNVPSDVRAQYPGGVDSLTSQQFLDLWKAKVERLGGGSPASTNEVSNGAPMATPIGGAPIAGGPVPLTPPNQRYSKLADMLMAQAAGSKVEGWGDALRALGGTALGYSLADKHDTKQQEYRGKLAEALGGASTPDAMTSVLIGSGDDDLVKAGVSLKAKQAEANQPLRGKDRFMALPNGDVLDLNTMGPVPGIKPKQELTNDMREYAFSMKQRQDQGQPLVPFDEWAKTMKPNTANRVPSGYRETPDGRLEFIPGGPADPATKSKEGNVTEGAAKAANFANMMDKSEAELTKLAPVGPDGKPDPTKLSNPLGVGGQIREALTPEAAANHMRSPEYQQYRQAAMQWVRAKLRKESGAQISPDEFEGDFRTFFPQPGDDAKVIEQKRQARAQALEGMKAESRGSFDQMFPAAQADPNQPTPVKTETIDPATGRASGAAPTAAMPAKRVVIPGTIEEGYRFKGGNPADPNNWEEVR